jgi:transcriptional regulator with XRE-family HTH domain
MAAVHNPETSPAVFLGRELQRARIAAGFKSQDALAVRLGFDRTVITKAESGARVPSDDVLSAWCEACGLDIDLYSRLTVLARSGDGPVPTWFEDWLEAERAATMLRIWSPLLIPGLFQPDGYARAVFLASQTDTSDENMDALVAARLERQVILDRADPPETVVVLDESVLHRLIGSPQIVHDALVYLADMSERPNISVHVVPSVNGANTGLSGAFDIASADGMPDVVRMEAVEDVTSERRALVRQAAIAFERVRRDALPRAVSRDLIRKVAEELWKTT